MLFSIEIENSRPSSNSNWLSSRTCMINILCQNCWEVINSGDSFLKDSCKALHTFPSKLKLPIASLSLDAEYLLQWLNLAYFLFFRTFFLPYFCNQSILHCNSFFFLGLKRDRRWNCGWIQSEPYSWISQIP